jgi:hypothetical protein
VLLFASIPRPDLLVIAADRPFLRALPNTSRYLLFVGDTSSRLGLLRRAAEHLRRGGALLTFPRGEIEPDPAVLPGAVDALEQWTDSVMIFARLVPELVVVPAVVSGVLSRAAQRNPLTQLRRTKKDREWLGAMLQVMFTFLARVEPRVEFAEPIRPRVSPTGEGVAPQEVWQQVLGRVRERLEALRAG